MLERNVMKTHAAIFACISMRLRAVSSQSRAKARASGFSLSRCCKMVVLSFEDASIRGRDCSSNESLKTM